MKTNLLLSMFLVGSTGCLNLKTAAKAAPDGGESIAAPDFADPNADGAARSQGDGGAQDDGGVQGDGAVAPGDMANALPDMTALPATCVEVKVEQPSAIDGAFTLYVGKDVSKPWVAFCANMAGSPKEYLSFDDTGAGQNYSQYTTGGYATGTSVRTVYTKVRINPTTLQLDVTDETYSTTTGMLTGGGNIETMTYATAMDCRGAVDGAGSANVDLTGLPFAVLVSNPAQFKTYGASANGGAVYVVPANKIVNLTGGGDCGWTSPVGVDPSNPVAGWSLQLVYSL